MQVACYGSTRSTGNPEIGASGIQNNLEVLSGLADANGAEVYNKSTIESSKLIHIHTLSIQKVLDGDFMGALEIDSSVLDLIATHKLLSVLVAKSLHVLIDGSCSLSRY